MKRTDDSDDTGPCQSPEMMARWCPPVISWFITPFKYRYIYHKPKLLEL